MRAQTYKKTGNPKAGLPYHLRLGDTQLRLIARPVFQDGFHILFRPSDKVIHAGQEGKGSFGQRILYLWRYFGIDFPADKPVFLQGAQRYGQHLLGYIGDMFPQGIEAHHFAFAQGVKH